MLGRLRFLRLTLATTTVCSGASFKEVRCHPRTWFAHHHGHPSQTRLAEVAEGSGAGRKRRETTRKAASLIQQRLPGSIGA